MSARLKRNAVVVTMALLVCAAAALNFAETLRTLDYTAEVPLFESEYNLMDGGCLAKGRDFPRDKEKRTSGVSEVFRRLLAALEKLSGIANGYRQGANRDVAAPPYTGCTESPRSPETGPAAKCWSPNWRQRRSFP